LSVHVRFTVDAQLVLDACGIDVLGSPKLPSGLTSTFGGVQNGYALDCLSAKVGNAAAFQEIIAPHSLFACAKTNAH
jgi:hypothetical protein